MLSIVLCRRLLQTGYNQRKLWIKSFTVCAIKSRRQICSEWLFSNTSIHNPLCPALGLRVIFSNLYYLYKVMVKDL